MDQQGSFDHGQEVRHTYVEIGTTRALLLLLLPDACGTAHRHDALKNAGYDLVVVETTVEAHDIILAQRPDLLLLADPLLGELANRFVSSLRADVRTAELPVIVLGAQGSTQNVAETLDCGADDVVSHDVQDDELLARVRVRLARPPTPLRRLPRDRRTGLLTEVTFAGPLQRELDRASLNGRPLWLAYLQLEELPSLQTRYGPHLHTTVARQLDALISSDARLLDVTAQDADGRFLLLLPELGADAAMRRLRLLAQRVVEREFLMHGDQLRLTPVIGFARYVAGQTPDELTVNAALALAEAEARLDLLPVLYSPARHLRTARSVPKAPSKVRAQLQLPFQVALVVVLTLGLPLVAYMLFAMVGIDLSNVAFPLVVTALTLTAALIWAEGLLALDPDMPPREPASPYPRASAVIAAYLPNEAATVVQTIEAFLMLDYPGELDIILAYNTPRSLPVEQVLRELSQRDPRFRAIRVQGSTSKAQNVNAALAHVRGAFVGVFDADHHPDPGSFQRVWRWLSNGWDVVQGHCLIRNGSENALARTVAIEFESIYAVSHPGRAKMHGFGVFGGSNGFWKTAVLRQIRFQHSMLTEDIDSSMRALLAGYKIGSDPYLISRELAPTTLRALTYQRLRWAQGWLQVSLRHLWAGLRSPRLSVRQKLGLFHLLGWRELYPLLSVQIVPILLFWWLGPQARHIDWFVPVLVMVGLYTLGTGPGQTLFAYIRGAPELRARGHWFWAYAVVASFLYTPYKNLIAVVAQVKEVMRERQWRVTPRTARPEAES